MKKGVIVFLIFSMLAAVLCGCKEENVIEIEMPGEIYTPDTYVPSQIDSPDISQ